MPVRAAADFDVLRCPLEGGVHLIEASAGTGKTWNLSALYLRLLLEKRLDVRQILVVTFTRPAAAELRERIRGRLAQAHRIATGSGGDPFVASLLQTVGRNADAPPAELAKRLHAALVAFDEAAIHTIHAFCQRALAQIPFAAGLPAHHELLQDDTELLQAALEDFWRCHVAGGRIPEALAAHLVRCDDSPQRWRELLRYLLAKPMAQLQWPEAAAATLPAALQRLAAAYDAAARAWAQPGPSPLDVLQSAVGLNRNAFKPAPIAEGARFWADDLHGGDLFGRAAKEARQRMALFCASRQQQALNRAATAPQHPFFDAADALVAARAAAQQALSLARIELIRQLRDEAGERVRLAKRQQRLVCFDDLLLRVHEALADHDRSDAHGGERSADSERSGLADALRACYPVALIDEFQDTDPIQYAIFERLYAGDAARGPLFLVGDPKQAIYGFRNADLHVYLNAKSDAATLHTLRYNQRSVQPLIDACNRLFGANPQAFVLPGLDSPRIEPGDKRPLPLRDDTERDGVGAALRIGWLPAAGTNGPLMKPDAERIAAAATAAEIARLLREARDGRIRIGDTPLQPGRIAVLVRTHAQGGRIKQALWALGVGSVELAQASIFASEEAADLQRVLLAMLEPAHPGRLFAALTTGLIGCDAAEVAAIADDEPRVLALVERFCGYRDTWRARGFGTMFRRWLRDDGIDSRLLARRDGERRLTNLLHLAELLQDTAASAMAPEALVRWLADRRDAPPADEELALRLESDQNLVQIVTIHKSKGLEYDVVFCPFLWTKPPAPRQPDDWREYHDADGRLVLDFRPQARDDPAIRQRCVREHHAESLRLIYVAMTRAIHRCYLVAGLYHESPGGSEPRIGDSASCLLNWLVDDSRTAFDDWLTAAKAPQAIEASWHRFAHTLGSACRLETLAADPAAAAAPLPAPKLELQPPPAPPPVPLPWRIGSFSGLAHGAADDAAAAADHDARAIAADESRADSPVAADDFLRFPRGASAGDCLHAAFERAEFTDPASWGPAVERALAAHPQRLPKLDDAEAQPLLKAMLSNALSNALTARLPGGLTLASVPPRSRRVELAFHLPAAGVRDAPLQSLLGDHGYAVAPLRFEPLDGYLNGYIDLVFEHAGRYYIVDWKSNHLGWRRDDYEAASIAQAMRANRYPLQYLLYALALHRHLGRRLPGYDYERHFGGVYYLFVRGLRPQWSGDRNNAPGVLFDRPRRDTIGALDALIGGAAS